MGIIEKERTRRFIFYPVARTWHWNLIAPPHPNIGHLPPSHHTVTNNGTKYKLLFIKMADGVMAVGFELFEMAHCGTGVK